MKIIDLSDEILSIIYEKWNYDNIIDFSYGYPYFRIPKELCKEELYYSESNYCSPDYDGWSSANRFKRLNEFTGLTDQEFFDICILHINDTDLRPTCDYCGDSLGFINMTWGYSYGGPWKRSIHHFCSNECCRNFRIDSCEAFGFRNPEVQAKIKRTRFISEGNPNDNCYLYINKIDGKFKFGITRNIRARYEFYRGYHKSSYPRVIAEGSRIFIADLEYLIKSKLNWKEYLEFKGTMSEFRRVFKESYESLINEK